MTITLQKYFEILFFDMKTLRFCHIYTTLLLLPVHNFNLYVANHDKILDQYVSSYKNIWICSVQGSSNNEVLKNFIVKLKPVNSMRVTLTLRWTNMYHYTKDKPNGLYTGLDKQKFSA